MMTKQIVTKQLRKAVIGMTFVASNCIAFSLYADDGDEVIQPQQPEQIETQISDSPTLIEILQQMGLCADFPRCD